MRFLDPWAWLGLATMALPIAVHLLRRQRANRQPFPTLRFLPVTRLISVRRDRLSDIPLMLVRLAILAAAVAALAQPIWPRAATSSSAANELSRAVVVDRGANMARVADDGRPASEAATSEIAKLTPAAARQVVVNASDLPDAISSAAGWLSRQPGQRELVVISDFPIGAMAQADLAAVPPNAGVRLIRVAVRADAVVAGAPVYGKNDRGAFARVPRATLTVDRTEALWGDAIGTKPPDAIEWLASAAEQPRLDLARAAAATDGIEAGAVDRPIAIVLPGASERAAMIQHARAIDRPWMFDAVAALSRDATLTSAAREAVAVTADVGAPFVPVVRNAQGRLLLGAAASAAGNGAGRLILISSTDAATVFTAALAGAAPRATSPRTDVEPLTMSMDQLAHWQRAPGPAAPGAATGDAQSQGRWFWAFALLLLGAETWLRRRAAAGRQSLETVHARVA